MNEKIAFYYILQRRSKINYEYNKPCDVTYFRELLWL